jgi:inner membrane protein
VDTLTHALSGALLARATNPKDAPPRSLPRRIAAGFFACASPDLDFVVGFFGAETYLAQHRGVTHSLVLLPLWALLFSWILARILREPRGWRALYGVTAMGIALHIAGDWITGFGTMVLAPFSDYRAALGTTFIIDLWFSGIIVAGLIVSLFFRKTRIPSVAALALLAGYVGFQYVQKQKAIEFGVEYARSKAMKDASVTAHPRPPSPFNWTVFVSDDRAHRFSHVNLLRKEEMNYKPGDGFVARLDAPYLPLDRAIWVTRSRYGETEQEMIRQAWNADSMKVYRWFADLPAFDGMTPDPWCAYFVDLRFLTPGRDAMPFRYGSCRASSGAPWRLLPPQQ